MPDQSTSALAYQRLGKPQNPYLLQGSVYNMFIWYLRDMRLRNQASKVHLLITKYFDEEPLHSLNMV